MTSFPKLDSNLVPDDLVGSDNTLRANIILNAFRIAVNGSLSVQNMVDGVVDEFEDETGVDTTISTDETYDSADDYYHNPTPAGSNVLTGGSNHTSTPLHEGSASLPFDGNTGTQLRFADATTDYVYLQLASPAIITSFRYRTGTADVATHLTGWTVFGSQDGSSWSSSLGTMNHGTGASVNTWYGPEALTNETSYAWYKFQMGSSGNNSNAYISEIEAFEDAVAPNMVLVSEIATAETAPHEAYLVVWQEDVDAVTLNTDLVGAISRDDGTTWTNVTLVEEAMLATGRILAGSVDISGQPSDTDMLWRLTGANIKEMKIHGVGLSWS
jgi:hypothetical protein